MVMPEGPGKEAAVPRKQWTASEMGKIGGPIGGRMRMASLSKKKRRALARKAAMARWDKVRKAKKAEEVKNVEM
jgi:hypothetical protein